MVFLGGEMGWRRLRDCQAGPIGGRFVAGFVLLGVCFIELEDLCSIVRGSNCAARSRYVYCHIYIVHGWLIDGASYQ